MSCLKFSFELSMLRQQHVLKDGMLTMTYGEVVFGCTWEILGVAGYEVLKRWIKSSGTRQKEIALGTILAIHKRCHLQRSIAQQGSYSGSSLGGRRSVACAKSCPTWAQAHGRFEAISSR